jgi:ATP-binding cassette subfamily B protein
VLTGADLRVAAGEKVGLMGLSGAGKTTLIDLLQRHYDPDAGRILLDGIDLRELDLAELRRGVAVVAQDTVLLKASLLDNLRYAAPESSEAAVVDAARRAEVDAFAARLPDGYASDVGSAGSALSGGQRQRIAIARALLQDPLVLVLDEATSAVDQATEARIIDAIDRLFADRTRLVISHRPATLGGVDRLIELADGRLIERPRAA